MPSKPLARVRSKERQRCAMSTVGSIRENCRRSFPKARFRSTRKCRRSPFPTRMCTRYLPTSMLLDGENKIGGSCDPFDGGLAYIEIARHFCTVHARSNYQG